MGHTMEHLLQCVHVSPIFRVTTLPKEHAPSNAPRGHKTRHQYLSPSTATNPMMTMITTGGVTWVINVNERVKITKGSVITSKLNFKADTIIKNTNI